MEQRVFFVCSFINKVQSLRGLATAYARKLEVFVRLIDWGLLLWDTRYTYCCCLCYWFIRQIVSIIVMKCPMPMLISHLDPPIWLERNSTEKVRKGITVTPMRNDYTIQTIHKMCDSTIISIWAQQSSQKGWDKPSNMERPICSAVPTVYLYPSATNGTHIT